MANKRKTTKRTTRNKATGRTRSGSRVRNSRFSIGKIGNVGFGVMFAASLIAVLALVSLVYYRSIADSEFFKVKTVDVRGVERASTDDITRTVLGSTEKVGLLDADISELRGRIEKLPFVRTASVTRQFPSGIRVDVVEFQPVAIVRLRSGDHLVDESGTIIERATKPEPEIPFAMIGWDETKSEEAVTNNKQRLRLYKKMVSEWSQFGLTARVKKVDMTRLGEPAAIIEESGREISVMLSKDKLGRGLRTAIEVIAGKGDKVRSINVADLNPIINFIEN